MIFLFARAVIFSGYVLLIKLPIIPFCSLGTSSYRHKGKLKYRSCFCNQEKFKITCHTFRVLAHQSGANLDIRLGYSLQLLFFTKKAGLREAGLREAGLREAGLREAVTSKVVCFI